MTKAWGIVPASGIPAGALVLLAPSTPPTHADLSIIRDIAGCCLLDPNEYTGLWAAQAFIIAADVAIPDAWQMNPRRDVSYFAKSR